jgi:hypothetical protein
MCKVTRTSPSYLLHPLDLIGSDHAPELKFFPGMNMQSDKKVKIFEASMKMLKKHFELLPMGEFAKRLSEDRKVIRLSKN